MYVHPVLFFSQGKPQTKEIEMNATAAAAQVLANLVAKGMTKEDAAAYIVERLTERPELAAKVFAGLVAA